MGFISGFLLLDELDAFAGLAPALVASAWMMAAAAHNRQLDRQPQPETITP